MSRLAIAFMIDLVDPSMPARGVLTFVLVAATGDAGFAGLAAEVLARHGGRVRGAVAGEPAVVATFHHPDDALMATAELGERQGAALPSDGTPIQIAVHTGSVDGIDQDGLSPTLTRGLALLAQVPPGRILVSPTTRMLLQDEPPQGTDLRLLGAAAGADLDRCYEVRHRALASTLSPWPIARDQPGVPTYATSFVGREAELAHLAELVSGTRLLTVTGPAGSGKTRLVHALLGSQRDRFEGGAVWVDLTTIDDPCRLASEVASRCGLGEGPGGADPLLLVTNHLRANHRLVVLDNCEHLLDAVADLTAQILATEGSSLLVATSREPIGVAGELTWRIPSLGLPESRAGAEAERACDAIRLFVERAAAVLPALDFDDDAIGAVVQICRRLDGIPLAIELAAPRLRALSLEDLATGLDNRFRLLTSGPRSIERQRTLQASIDWSHDLLDEPEQVTFRRLAVFAGPFDLADAEAVITDALLSRFDVFERVASLVDKSLVHRVDDRYVLLESIRAYAGQKAGDAGELEDLRNRHLRHMLALAAAWEFDRRVASRATLDDATRHRADIRLALGWAQVHEPASIIHLLTPLVHVLGAANLYDEVNILVRSTAESEREGSEPWCQIVAASIQYLSIADGWWSGAARTALATPSLLPSSVCRRLRYGLVATDMFVSAPGADAAVAELIDGAEEERDELFVHQAGVNLAYAIALGGDPPRAEPYLTWIERHAADAPQINTVAQGARNWIDLCRCDLDRVSDTTMQLVSGTTIGPGLAVSAVVGAFYAGSVSLLRALRERVRTQEFSGLFEFVPSWIDLNTALLEDDVDAAHRAAEHALSLPLVDSLALMRAVAAEVALSCGDLELAHRRAAEAAARAEGLDAPFPTSLATYARAQVARVEGDHARATELAFEALEVAHRHQVRCVAVTALECLALSAAERGQPERAARILGACRAFRRERGYLGQYPYMRVAIEAAEAELDPAHLDAGAARSFEEIITDVCHPRRRGGRPVSGLDALTPAERRVAALATDGLTNREIADALVVSNATVKTHLVHVYQKLGIRSRAQLVATYLRPHAFRVTAPDTPTATPDSGGHRED